MSNQVSTFFDTYAADFDAIYGNDRGLFNRVANRLFRKSMRERYEKTIAGSQPVSGKKVLDVGCGPGHYSVTLAKMGAVSVLGLDFASGMLDIARTRAVKEGVSDRCTFEQGDFFTRTFSEDYDVVIVMGFMDYVEDASRCVNRVLSLTRGKAFFTFPVAGGLLGWQRQLRYKSRCPLYLYREDQVHNLFRNFPNTKVEQIHRDFFVTSSK
jgi:2-polyprenyl-3-methyl-5-hydroxy-6-metoxy-1,4-benzoquinol methylase